MDLKLTCDPPQIAYVSRQLTELPAPFGRYLRVDGESLYLRARFPTTLSSEQIELICSAAVEMAKEWRTDRYLRRLEAMMAVADAKTSLTLTGVGDVLEPDDGLIGIGSGGAYALAAARALLPVEGQDAESIARRICVQLERMLCRPEEACGRGSRARGAP